MKIKASDSLAQTQFKLSARMMGLNFYPWSLDDEIFYAKHYPRTYVPVKLNQSRNKREGHPNTLKRNWGNKFKLNRKAFKHISY